MSARFCGLIAAYVAVVCWALLPVIFKGALVGGDLYLNLVTRFAISCLMLLPFLFGALVKIRKHISQKILLLILLVIVMYFSQAEAMRHVSIACYVLIFSLNPLAAMLLFRYRLQRQHWCGLVAIMAGLIISQQNHIFSFAHPVDLLFLILGTVTWVLYTYMCTTVEEFDIFELLALNSLAGLIAASFVWLTSAANLVGFNQIILANNFIVAILSLTGSYLFLFALKQVPLMSIFSQYLEPILSIWFAHWWLNESVNRFQVLGMLVLILGLIIFGFNKRPTSAKH